MNPISKRSCGVLCVRAKPDRAFLIMRHGERLDLPKGHVEPGETDVQCALRELEEETGIRSDQVKLVDGFHYENHYRFTSRRGKLIDKTLIMFLGELTEQVEIVVTEHEGFLWVPVDGKAGVHPHVDPLLALARDFLG